MKRILFLVITLANVMAFAQVGINTQNPLDVFHIDGAKDNPATGAPSVVQQSNDVIVTSAGNVGIGTITPSTKLEIQTGGTSSAPITGFKLVDGNQAAGKYLISDAYGVGSWMVLNEGNSSKLAANGIFGTAVVTSDETATTLKYSGVMMHVDPGRWLLSSGIKVNFTADAATPLPYGTSYFLNFYISSSQSAVQQTGFTIENISAANNITFGGNIMRGKGIDNGNFMQGSKIINVTSPTGVDLYLLIQNVARPAAATSGAAWSFNPASGENFFYAVPINP
ncbi:hypothetical protein [Soonwooa sp.]|uniref:hypothetical protein n=1 Tax=Soonwooa sp. TaxID=1938592 RepID=UPI002631C8AB|nr:hypothetical protein [Soonwooa sp.]